MEAVVWDDAQDRRKLASWLGRYWWRGWSRSRKLQLCPVGVGVTICVETDSTVKGRYWRSRTTRMPVRSALHTMPQCTGEESLRSSTKVGQVRTALSWLDWASREWSQKIVNFQMMERGRDLLPPALMGFWDGYTGELGVRWLGLVYVWATWLNILTIRMWSVCEKVSRCVARAEAQAKFNNTSDWQCRSTLWGSFVGSFIEWLLHNSL